MYRLFTVLADPATQAATQGTWQLQLQTCVATASAQTWSVTHSSGSPELSQVTESSQVTQHTWAH